ncbi:MAG TPA: hypothetical protein VGN72_03010 [Tepidisphaeraceae bacterium]|jgi:hypothetical protein|nr:hypothetical protein [Tepidisphaeraceae bacterium]
MTFCPRAILLLLVSACASHVQQSVVHAAAPMTTIRPLPADARITTDFATDTGKGPEALTDNDPKTFLFPAPNSAARPATPKLRFLTPLTDLAGVATGDAEPFKNYYAQEMRFYVDTDGDGYCEMYVGSTSDLGPGSESRGTHLFGRKPEVAHGLDIFVVRQHRAGVQRAFTLNELQLVHSPDAFGDPALAEPADGPARSGPPTVNPNVPTPTVVLDMAQKPRLRLNRDKANKQEARLIDSAGQAAYRVTWLADSNESFAEIVLLGEPPLLHGFGAGTVLSVPVNADAFPGFRSIGARVRDANGETFRWSAELDPNASG